MCLNGTWGTVCSNSFDDVDASVVCKHLAFSPYGNFYIFLIIVLYAHTDIGVIPLPGSYYNYYRPNYIFDLNCTGMESNVWDCPYDDSDQYCSYSQVASVICQCK